MILPSKCIDLASHVLYCFAVMNSSLLLGYWNRCIAGYITIKLNNLEKMGVVATKLHPFYDIAPRVPLLKVLEITPDGIAVFWITIQQTVFLNICVHAMSAIEGISF